MSAQKRYFITTTIAYVNGKPHIGLAEEFVQADAFARFRRLIGDDTYLLTGTDENSLKNVLAAEREGITPHELVERNSSWFKDLADSLGLSYDQFIRTAADPRHAAASQKIWRAVDASEDIYKRQYAGLYCVGCEQYYDESDLLDGLCPEHLVAPLLVEEENYFFRLSRYGPILHELISSDKLRIIPEFRKNEILSFISSGLQDFSISRSMTRAHGWGIPVPDDPSQVMYVWFDALTNYISALGYDDDSELFQRFWVNNPHRVHALGKGVIRFHAVYWPAMLLSAGLPLPETEFVHGYINMAGAKVSKSLGNVIDPQQLVSQYGSEAVRYFLLRGISATRDADFNDIEHFHDQLRSRYNADLANDLGNLLNRTVSMIGRYRDGSIPAPSGDTRLECSVQETAARMSPSVVTAMESYDPQAALNAIWQVVTRANQYAEQTAPWTLAKAARGGDETAAERLSTALYTLAESVRLVAAALEPFLPDTGLRIRDQLGAASGDLPWRERLTWGVLPVGTRVASPQPIFPRLEAPDETTLLPS